MLILMGCYCWRKIRASELISLQLFPFVILENACWFLLLVLINNLRNLFIFCINVDTDEMLLYRKVRAQGFIPLWLIPFVLLEKLLWHDNRASTVKSAHLKVFVHHENLPI